MTIRDKLIYTLRQARARWYHQRRTCPSGPRLTIEEALADAILAEFAVMDKFAHARMMAEVALGRIDKHIDEDGWSGIGWRPCRYCGHPHDPEGICIS